MASSEEPNQIKTHIRASTLMPNSGCRGWRKVTPMNLNTVIILSTTTHQTKTYLSTMASSEEPNQIKTHIRASTLMPNSGCRGWRKVTPMNLNTVIILSTTTHQTKTYLSTMASSEEHNQIKTHIRASTLMPNSGCRGWRKVTHMNLNTVIILSTTTHQTKTYLSTMASSEEHNQIKTHIRASTLMPNSGCRGWRKVTHMNLNTVIILSTTTHQTKTYLSTMASSEEHNQIKTHIRASTLMPNSGCRGWRKVTPMNLNTVIILSTTTHQTNNLSKYYGFK